jgi:hypothetical protein
LWCDLRIATITCRAQLCTLHARSDLYDVL